MKPGTSITAIRHSLPGPSGGGEPVASLGVDGERLWLLFDEVAAAVRDAVLDADLDPEEAGERAGQYRLDLVADAVVVDMLTGADVGVLSEESGRHFPERELCVVVDPVDGSTNAGRGLPHWATSLCAVDADGLVASTVVDHSLDVTWRAARGGFAWRADRGGDFRRIGAFDPPGQVLLEDAVVAVNGRSPAWPAARQFRAYGCLAVELCHVADGSLDGYANLDGDCHGPWDYLGGLLVLRESGMVAADRVGRELVTVEHSVRRDLVAACDRSLLAAMMSA